MPSSTATQSAVTLTLNISDRQTAAKLLELLMTERENIGFVAPEGEQGYAVTHRAQVEELSDLVRVALGNADAGLPS